MQDRLLSYWWAIWMIAVPIAYIWFQRRKGESIFPWRQNPDRYSNRVVLGQLLIVAIGLVFIAIALAVVALL